MTTEDLALRNVNALYGRTPKDCKDLSFIIDELEKDLKARKAELVHRTGNRKKYLDIYVPLLLTKKDELHNKFLNDCSNDSIVPASGELKGKIETKNRKNLVLYGVGGLILILTVAGIIYKSKKK